MRLSSWVPIGTSDLANLHLFHKEHAGWLRYWSCETTALCKYFRTRLQTRGVLMLKWKIAWDKARPLECLKSNFTSWTVRVRAGVRLLPRRDLRLPQWVKLHAYCRRPITWDQKLLGRLYGCGRVVTEYGSHICAGDYLSWYVSVVENQGRIGSDSSGSLKRHFLPFASNTVSQHRRSGCSVTFLLSLIVTNHTCRVKLSTLYDFIQGGPSRLLGNPNRLPPPLAQKYIVWLQGRALVVGPLRVLLSCSR